MSESENLFTLERRIQFLEDSGEKIALIEGGRSYTYRELFLRSRSIAVHLKEKGLKKGECVAVYSMRSFEEVAAYLAVWWCEGFYLPLDAKTPLKRLGEYTFQSGSKFVLIQSALESSIESFCYFLKMGFSTIQLAEIANIDSVGLELPKVSPDDPAYLIFTSGSTGLPKGVVIPHRGVQNLISWYHRHHGFSQNERYSMVAAPGFDASISEIWPPLACGGTLCVMSDDSLLYDPENFAKWFCEEKINVGYIPYSVLELMFRVHWPKNSLRLIFTGGGRLRSYPPSSFPCPVINQYGPTEATDTSTEAVLWPGISRSFLPPIGKPIDGVEISIVNQDLQPSAIGEVGELLIAGLGVGIGYINDIEKTKEKFIDLSVNQKNKRYYRTGDLVRLNESGELEYCGRLDKQIKILGQRAELTEIEMAILSFDEIKNVTVIFFEKTQSLFCYYVAFGGVKVNSTDLIHRLEKSLPKFMIPTFWCPVEKIPLTANGKIDEESLKLEAMISQFPAAPPSCSATEKVVYQSFKEVLKIHGEFSLDKSFFSLGGNSLLAGMVLGRINKTLSTQLSLAIMLEHSSARELARFIDSKHSDYIVKNFVKITDSSSGTPLFCIHGFGGYAFQFAHLALYLSPSYPLYIFQANGQGEMAIQMSIINIARSYLRQIKEVQPRGPYRVIGYSLGGLVAIELSRLMIEEGDLVDFLGLIDTYGPGYPLLAPLHQRIFIHIRNLVRASWVDRNKYLIKRFDNLFRRFHSAIGMPHDQNPDIPGLEDPVSRELYLSHEKAWDEYRARPLDLEMHLFRAENDPKDPGTDYSDLYMGWSPYFPKGIHLHRVPGNHFSLFSQSNIKTLAKEIENSYGRALLLDNR